MLRHGRAVEHGATSDILSRPGEDYTRRLVTAGRARPPRGAATARTPVLTAEGVGMAYGRGARVLEGINLSLSAGETLALVGESGSGKTTLGRVITGLHPDADGTVTLLGAPLPLALARRSREQLRRLQIVQQIPDAVLNPRQTVGTVLARPLSLYDRVRGGPAQKRRIEELLEAVELDPALLERYPASLSGGQKQRVCIARALAAEPDVIVCDEPTSALDPLVAEGVLDLLARLQAKTGVALLFITHDIAIVRALAHSVAIMARGRIVRQGPTREALAPPFDTETARLLDAVPELDVSWLTGWRERRERREHDKGTVGGRVTA
ncbi:ATP-binding cassette domain-containing protein [Ancylobacter sp. WKF20]|uniref:ABC transporter ATP-binding protein n=1 Tax=Ancylobacter sp. WKF20 TaxID=3039801 RepID=UPI00243462EB|nr:ATP-binding cassette domain-containing protein [Ancylobacter sp. WKF20]WGD30550.1 ATP-binding cassette domain-containing protein [Ancylobacter sp. WKF20]